MDDIISSTLRVYACACVYACTRAREGSCASKGFVHVVQKIVNMLGCKGLELADITYPMSASCGSEGMLRGM